MLRKEKPRRWGCHHPLNPHFIWECSQKIPNRRRGWPQMPQQSVDPRPAGESESCRVPPVGKAKVAGELPTPMASDQRRPYTNSLFYQLAQLVRSKSCILTSFRDRILSQLTPSPRPWYFESIENIHMAMLVSIESANLTWGLWFYFFSRLSMDIF